MHIKEQAKIITENVSSVAQTLKLLTRNADKFGIEGLALDELKKSHYEINQALAAIRGE